jgi:hypothetical protein
MVGRLADQFAISRRREREIDRLFKIVQEAVEVVQPILRLSHILDQPAKA